MNKEQSSKEMKSKEILKDENRLVDMQAETFLNNKDYQYKHNVANILVAKYHYALEASEAHAEALQKELDRVKEGINVIIINAIERNESDTYFRDEREQLIHELNLLTQTKEQ